ncbi:hypothetical protein CONLIGDRAFT_244164 [Coniochaeta ligniaria NRRL 30616]|uniref:Uncharacterized protein n=1 Tax=Coniochaeta ligniaria NRRL 30616 TaxID=1408157 RepID=A0A1J7IVX1_9PEZI|nr:hypothetical protein CONLIGDRAFT_244164 [Coniochaeta ligniaria NRRL 30616]
MDDYETGMVGYRIQQTATLASWSLWNLDFVSLSLSLSLSLSPFTETGKKGFNGNGSWETRQTCILQGYPLCRLISLILLSLFSFRVRFLSFHLGRNRSAGWCLLPGWWKEFEAVCLHSAARPRLTDKPLLHETDETTQRQSLGAHSCRSSASGLLLWTDVVG